MGETHNPQFQESFQPSLSDPFNSTKRDLTISTSGLLSSKEYNQKGIFMDMLSVSNQNKDLKLGIQQMEAKLQEKEHEIINLKYQLEMKDTFEEPKPQDKVNVLTQRCTNKSPASGEINEKKASKFLKGLDTKRGDKILEEENSNLNKEVTKLKEKLVNYENEKKILQKELNKAYEKMSRERSSRGDGFESDKDELSKNNETLRLENGTLSEELSMLKEENSDMKKRYEDLKSCYDALETLTSNRFSDYSMESTPLSDMVKSGTKDNSRRLFGHDGKRGEDSLSSIRTNVEVGDLSLAECRKLISEIMDIYKIKNPTCIINSIHKTEKVIQAIPRLRKLIADISGLVLPRVGIENDSNQVEMIIPSLKKCFKGLDELDALKGLRKKLVTLLELKKECTNFEILKKVDNLLYIDYQYNDLKSQRTPRESTEKSVIDIFTKTFGVKPDSGVFKQINTQLEDLKYFVNMVKQKLGLNPTIKNESCLKYLMKLLENISKDREAADIALQVQKILNCKLEAVPTKVEELVGEKFQYNPFGYEGRL